jgi:rhodanese-related sulfurtransferase
MAKHVSVTAAADLMQAGWRYLDVRSMPEFDAGHPPGAVNVPLLHAVDGRMVLNPDFHAVVTANFPHDAQLLVGCKMAGRSAHAVAALEAVGFANLMLVRGGFVGERDPFGRIVAQGWTDAGLPVETEAGPGQRYPDLAAKSPAGTA